MLLGLQKYILIIKNVIFVDLVIFYEVWVDNVNMIFFLIFGLISIDWTQCQCSLENRI